MAKKTKEFRK